MNLTKEITSAYQRISEHILNTPLLYSKELSRLNDGKVYLKLENRQYTGSFKLRGALNKVLSLSEEEKAKGLVTASTGNHAQGFARALSIANVTGTIYMPENADKSKIEKLKKYDVPLEFYGTNSLEAELHAKQIANETEAIWVSPYNDPDIIAGQGTIGIELTNELGRIDAVMGCIGGGGLMSGVAAWFKHESPETNIVGCLPKNSPEMYLSIQANKVVALPKFLETLSDGSAGGVEDGSITFDLCKKYVDDYLLATEEEIADAIRFAYRSQKEIIEGAAGVSLSCFITNARRFEGQTVVVIICGGNIAPNKLNEIL